MAVVQTRPYRRILTSALHRRFVHASALSLLVSYIIAIAIGEKSSCEYIATLSGRASKAQFQVLKHKELIKMPYAVFWLWFPFGSCGVRTALLFISSLTIFVLRVSQMHIGTRTASSSFGTLKSFTLLQIVQTFGWYIFSAWWFTVIYVWSSSSDSNLELVKRGRCVEYASSDSDFD